MKNKLLAIALSIFLFCSISVTITGCPFSGVLNPSDKTEYAQQQQDELVNSIYKVLKGTKDSYDVSMQSIAFMYNKGFISDENKEIIIKAGTIFIGLYKSAVNALITYEKLRTVESSQTLSIAVTDMSKSFSELMDTIKPLL